MLHSFAKYYVHPLLRPTKSKSYQYSHPSAPSESLMANEVLPNFPNADSIVSKTTSGSQTYALTHRPRKPNQCASERRTLKRPQSIKSKLSATALGYAQEFSFFERREYARRFGSWRRAIGLCAINPGHRCAGMKLAQWLGEGNSARFERIGGEGASRETSGWAA
jgi:hypothetical protein